MKMPIVAPMPTVKKPTASEIRPAHRRRENMSRFSSSVPSQCVAEGGAKPCDTYCGSLIERSISLGPNGATGAMVATKTMKSSAPRPTSANW